MRCLGDQFGESLEFVCDDCHCLCSQYALLSLTLSVISLGNPSSLFMMIAEFHSPEHSAAFAFDR